MVSERERGEGVESGERGSLWAVVLAGGEGTRLRPLVRHLCGDERLEAVLSLARERERHCARPSTESGC